MCTILSQKKERNVKNTEISDIEDNEIDSEEEELNDTTKTKKKNKYSHSTLNRIHFGLQNIHDVFLMGSQNLEILIF
ncbi:hypothetical protein RhiirA1_479576 [Rhizophagus irregularis]|uniref:Uncharacterized protein n=1 Tax=Rhizophagus irregularis TaxID=588596 RepID=A0A2N0QQG7_9GLOM|nr:hypothetical protein RhiirA1_479576 [Rhizophagus irregularis]